MLHAFLALIQDKLEISVRVASQAPKARPIPAWGVAPRAPAPDTRGLKARPILRSIPKIGFVAVHAVLLQERTQLILKRLLLVMRLLCINVVNQRVQIGRANREGTISSLPRKFSQLRGLTLQPFGRRCFNFRHQIRDVRRGMQAHRKMNMVRNASNPVALAAGTAYDGGKISMEPRTHGLMQQRQSVLCTEDHMDHNKRQRAGHSAQYRSGLQPSTQIGYRAWGFTPRWYEVAPLALFTFTLTLLLGCTPTPKPTTQSPTPAAATYPPRPTTPPPPLIGLKAVPPLSRGPGMLREIVVPAMQNLGRDC